MAGTKKDPAFLLYCTTWLQSGDVAALTLEQQGAYVRLLCFAWLDGSIPADGDELQQMLGVQGEAFDRIWSRLSRRWSAMPGNPGRLINKRQEEERVERKQRAEEARARGQEGGKRSAEQRASGSRAGPQAEGQAETNLSTTTSNSLDGRMDGDSRTRNKNGEGYGTRSPVPAGDVAANVLRAVKP